MGDKGGLLWVVDRIMRREGVFDLAFRVLQARKGRSGSSFGERNMDEGEAYAEEVEEDAARPARHDGRKKWSP